MQISWMMTKPIWRQEIAKLVLGACLLMVVGSWLFVGVQLENEYKNTVRKIQAENANLAKVFEEHTALIISAVEDRLFIVKEAIESKGLVPPVETHIFTRIAAKLVANHMLVADGEGNVLASAFRANPDFTVADRGYFIANKDMASGRLYVGAPVTDRVLGKLAIPVSCRINNADGNFAGVAAGLISLESFGDFYRQMQHDGKRNVTIVGLDGITRVRISGDHISTGQEIDNTILLSQIGQHSASSFANGLVADAGQQFVSYRVMPDYPLYVAVDIAGDQALAPYYQHRRWYLVVLFCFDLVVLWGGMTLARKIDRLMQTKRELAVSEERYRTIIGSINDGIYVHDEKTGRILDVNEKGCEFYGFSREEMISSNIAMFGMGAAPYSEADAKQWFRLAMTGEPQIFEWQIRHKQGYVIWTDVVLKKIKIGEDSRVIAVVRDISERKVQEEKIWRIAYNDSLTGLPNRACLQEMLERELAKPGVSGTVFFVDMDGLKMVNDHSGHSCGDHVVKIVGKCLTAIAEDAAIVSRTGGDEFVLVLPEQINQEQVSRIADKIIHQLSGEYVFGASTVYMSASVGIVRYPKDSIRFEDILKKADQAMYLAKAAGGNSWRFYDESIGRENRKKALLKHGLRGAISRGELSLLYQPIIPAYGNGRLSFEALLRWASPEYGSVPPGQFIPLAEQSDTILKIGAWVMEEAARFARKLADMGQNEVKVWVNVSPRQLIAAGFVAFVKTTINNAGISPSQIGIEITENALIASLSDSVDKLKALRKIGIELAIDDFGTGYSSLTYLQSLPVQTIKTDKSFIRDIVSDEAQLRFVQCIFSLAHVLKLSVVVEGVENKEQLEKLSQSNCDYIQGYFFSRPVSANEAIRFIDSPRSASAFEFSGYAGVDA